MWQQFLLENIHFAVNLFASLAFFSVFWLYFDAWVERKTGKEALKILGFLLLALSFLANATFVESNILSTVPLFGGVSERVSIILRTVGYLLLVLGLVADPLQAKPGDKKVAQIAGIPGLLNLHLLKFATPVLAGASAWLYLIRSTKGLENHLKKVAYSLFIFSFYEVLSLTSVFLGTSNITIFNLVAPFGPVWILALITQAFGAFLLSSWAFSYLLKRINTQLFIIFTTTTLCLFLFTTVSFTFLLLKNLQDETITRLETDSAVLGFAVDSKKSEILSAASILAQNPQVASSITEGDRGALGGLAEELLLSKKLTSVLILDSAGAVLARGEERERISDSLSDDPLVKRAIAGEPNSSIGAKEGAIAPSVLVRGAVPILTEDETIGIILVSSALDNAFLDGIKQKTALSASIYAGDVLSATTISDLSGEVRPIGIAETNSKVKDSVLAKGEPHSGLFSLLNKSYFASYQPLLDVDNTTVGMLFVAREAGSVFATAGRSITLTFLVAAALIVLSVIPSYLISKYIYKQIK